MYGAFLDFHAYFLLAFGRLQEYLGYRLEHPAVEQVVRCWPT